MSAEKLNNQQVVEITAHEKLEPYLHTGEVLITNADKYTAEESDPMFWDRQQFLGSLLAQRLDNSEIWESARVIEVAYTTDGELMPTQVSVVGVRRNRITQLPR